MYMLRPASCRDMHAADRAQSLQCCPWLPPLIWIPGRCPQQQAADLVSLTSRDGVVSIHQQPRESALFCRCTSTIRHRRAGPSRPFIGYLLIASYRPHRFELERLNYGTMNACEVACMMKQVWHDTAALASATPPAGCGLLATSAASKRCPGTPRHTRQRNPGSTRDLLADAPAHPAPQLWHHGWPRLKESGSREGRGRTGDRLELLRQRHVTASPATLPRSPPVSADA